MACKLNSEQIKDLYGVIYGNIYNRVKDPKLPKFNMRKFILDTYKELMDPEDPMEEDKALLFIQAIPDIFTLVSSDSLVRDYIIDKDISLNEVLKLSKEFENPELKAVREYVLPRKRTKAEIKVSVKAITEAAAKLVLTDLKVSDVVKKNKSRVISVKSTTIQEAFPVNPESLTDEQRKKLDDEKRGFHAAVRTIAFLANNKDPKQQDVEYNGVPLRLKPVVVSTVKKSYFTEMDQEAIQKFPDGIVAFVSDNEGNILFFDEEGNLTDEKSGKPIYQYLRKVSLKEGKLLLSNRSDFYYNVVSPEEQVEQERKKAALNKLEYSDEFAKSEIKRIAAEQKKDLNQLYALRNFLLANRSETVLLPITGGSTGFVTTQYKPLSETDITEDEIVEYFIEDSGISKRGYSYFILSRTKGGIEINTPVYMQRGDITRELAEKIATILTTEAKLNGEELNPYQRKEYAATFIDNRVSKNRILIDVVEREGMPQLIIKTYATENDAAKDKNGVEITTAQEIVDHLMNAVLYGKEGEETKVYPANVSYNKKYIGGKTFVEYTVRDNKITSSDVNYLDFIKPFIKIEFSADSYSFFSGINAYLTFAIPDEIKPESQEYQVGFVTDKDQGKPAKKETKKEEEKTPPITFSKDRIKVRVARKFGYSEAATQAIKLADGALSFALDFSGSAEGLVKRTAKDFFGVKLDAKKDAPKNLVPSAAAVKNIVTNINKFSPSKLYVSGSDVAALKKAGYSQKDIDTYMFNILDAVTKSKDLETPITQIISTGQTGVQEALVKAADRLGITSTIIAPKGYAHRVLARRTDKGYKDINDKESFLGRFGPAENSAPTTKEVEEDEVEVVVLPKTRSARKKREKKTVTIEVQAIEPTVEEKKKEDAVRLVSPIDAILNAVPPSLLPPKKMERNKKLSNIFDRAFTSKKDKAKAEAWWEKSGLSALIPLERITAIVNSDAFATWSRDGITLYEGDGGTSIDIYHEAWHGFSQIFLTYDEKVNLYSHLRDNYPKYATADFEEIEESIAEDFRSFMKFKQKFPGLLGKIFEKIGKILRTIFGKLTRRDFTRPRDIPMVKEMYDNLYNNELAKYSPSIKNAMPEFTVLNRAKTIQLPKGIKEGFPEFSLAESDKISTSIDSIFAMNFRNYAKAWNAPTAANDILTNPTNRKAMYEDAKQKFDALRKHFISEFNRVAQENLTSDTPNDFLEAQLLEKVELLTKVVEGFGDIDKSLDGTQKTGVVAYHIKNSRFNILKKALVELGEDEEDASNIAMSRSGREQEDNNKSSKEFASAETMMLLASVSKQTKEYDEKGNPIYELNDLLIPELEDPDVLWNRLARVLEGTMDPVEMYGLLMKYQENYPEFAQILALLPNPVQHDQKYKNRQEFEAETKFWQDLKKPLIKFKQLTISKTVLEKGGKNFEGQYKKEKATFESRVTRADMNTYGIIADWTANFTTATKQSNPFIDEKEDDKSLGVNVLDTAKLLRELAPGGVLPNKNSIRFLNALGISLDMNSYQINSIVNNTKAPFNNLFGINNIFALVQYVHNKSVTGNEKEKAGAEAFKRNPIYYLQKGLPQALRTSETNNESYSSKLRILAELQNEFSDGYSNFSTLTPEGNKVWEHFLDSTITRMVTSINKAQTWGELTDDEVDVNGRFKHMRWLAEENNPYSKFSKILSSIFYLDPADPDNYGKKRPNATLSLNMVGGTQLTVKDSTSKEGKSTSSADLTTKFLQEVHTMLSSGIEEFMRHASKNTAMSLTSSKVNTSNGNPGLYIDTKLFRPTAAGLSGNFGENQGFAIVSGYIAGEFERIYRFRKSKQGKNTTPGQDFKNWTGYNREVGKKNGQPVLAGEVFTAFDDVLTDDTKNELYAIADDMIAKGTHMDLLDYFDTHDTLRGKVKQEVIKYFAEETKNNVKRLKKAKYLDPSLYEDQNVDGLTVDQTDEMMMKSYTYNSWIHKFETLIIAYGDLAQYDHAKEEFHKRNAGLASGGSGFRSDMRAQIFVNDSTKFKRYYADRKNYSVRKYDGTFKTAILKEKKMTSIYYDEYFQLLKDNYIERLEKNPDIKKSEITARATEMAKTALEEYANNKMKEGDGQGHITFEAYRMFKNLEGNWTDDQEALYQKIAKGEKVEMVDIVHYFPPYKVQYFGNIQTTGLALTSFHKFSLAPLIPSVHSMDSNLGKLHDMMMKQQIDYVTFESGSKIGHISSNGSGDAIYNSDNETINTDLTFTVNTIFAEYLKNQTEINREYKKKSIFSTQLRKMILEGLYEQGRIASTDEDDITDPIVKRYINHVAEYTNLLKMELLNEIGFELIDGEYVPVEKDSNARLLELIRANLEKDDVLGDHLIDMIDINEDGSLSYDLSLHPEAPKIEKVLLSIINKRIIKQKVKGEALIQVSGAMYEGVFERPKFKKGSDADVKKYVGTNFLPTYHRKKDGKTAAMKVMIALQGDYENLLKLEYKGKAIETIERLNEAIKDDEWLDTDDNRKAVTMVGVRIPVQGLNSMEFMEVYHFLPPEAGNIIVPPTEIVAKSGGDFDIDKMSVFMPSIDKEGRYVKREYSDNDAVKEEIEDEKLNGRSGASVFKAQKAALENEMIEDMRAILELPSNYASLITPNGTFLLRDLADDLAQYVMEYNPFENRTNKKGPENRELSPTRVLESEYNLYKHESNVIGKRTLGLGAIENTFNVVFNSLGASMPNMFFHRRESAPREAHFFLKHNTMMKDTKRVDEKGNKIMEKVISLSHRYDANNMNKIADVFSQMINGWVDVEKDAWIFFIQGNYEVSPTLLYLVKAGVPIQDAVYFVSQPLVREYVDEQRLIRSTFADALRRKTDMPVRTQAARNVISRHFEKPKTLAKGRQKYDAAVAMSKDYFKDREAEFTTKEMYDLIKESAKDKTKADSELSRLMFLHFLQIEDQIQGITQLKVNSNPDTATDSTLFESEETLANLEALASNSKVDQDLFSSMLTDSIISSFFNQKMTLGISKPLFPLRYHPRVSDFLIGISKTGQLRDDAKATFGENKDAVLASVFRNDFISYILQNAVRKYKMKDSYTGYEMTTSIPVNLVPQLKFGAYVKVDSNGDKKLYVDMDKLREEFDSQAWVEGSENENSYAKRKLYPLKRQHFMQKRTTNFDEYMRFVAEREFLRDLYPIEDYKNTATFAREFKVTKKVKPNMNESDQVRYTYEKFLALRALENTFNPYHLFKDPDNSFAVQYSRILKAYPDLAKKYVVLQKIKPDANQSNTMFNLFLADREISNYKSNLYHSNLVQLADPSVDKVGVNTPEGVEENMRISDFFTKLSMIAFLQTGLSKTKFSFTNIADYEQFLLIMQQETAKFIKLLNNSDNANLILSDLYSEVIKENNVEKSDRMRFKNLISGLDFDDLENAPEPAVMIEVRDTAAPVKGIEISSNAQGLAAALTNPTELAKQKKNLDESYPVKFRGKTYKDAEAAFQALKDPSEANTKPILKDSKNFKLMYDILVSKLQQYPDLVKGITDRGGSPWILGSTHQPTKKNTVWETNGKNWFILALNAAYNSIEKENATDEATAVVISEPNVLTELEPLSQPGVFLFKNSDKNAKHYSNLVKDNNDTVFMTNEVIVKLNDKENKYRFAGESLLAERAKGMVIQIPTSQFKMNDNLADLNEQDYPKAIELFEKRIQFAKSLLYTENGEWTGAKVAFSDNGYGDPKKMPQKLFVYLSRRLYEEFGYLNPGSELFEEIDEIIIRKQGISDQEIINKFNNETTDPFKC